MKLTDAEKKRRFETVLKKSMGILKRAAARDEKLQSICTLLNEQIPYYDWVGFYLVDPEHPRELVLGPYVGAATDHTRIPFGRGICGQAAEREETFLIQDVSQENNYLACSVTVKSEIVVPVFSNGKVVGELDIDSHVLSPFSAADRQQLEQLCKALSAIF